MLKRVLVGLLCVMLISPLWITKDSLGCKRKESFQLDRVIIGIKAEYEQEFREESFTVEDFEWSNVERIKYGVWYSTLPEQEGWMTVYLKQHGKKHVLEAVEKFSTLDFVKYAEVSGIQRLQ